MKEPVLLNIGCGEFPQPGWINIDVHDGDGATPDLVADVLELPFESGTVDRVYMGHLLEHLSYEEDVFRALTEVKRVLIPGGGLGLACPDINRIQEWGDPDLLEHAKHGERRWPGDTHLWECTEELLLKAARRVFPYANPVSIETMTGWPCTSFIGWQCAVVASND